MISKDKIKKRIERGHYDNDTIADAILDKELNRKPGMFRCFWSAIGYTISFGVVGALLCWMFYEVTR